MTGARGDNGIRDSELHALAAAIAEVRHFTSPADQALSAYTGMYHCPELDCKYGIALKDHHLVLTNTKYNDAPLTFGGPDHLFNDFWAMYHLRMLRNDKGQVMGFEVNSDRVIHLKFNKIY